MVIWSNAAGTVIMTNADGSIIDDTQEAFEDCCCEPVIDPDKWYCVNRSNWWDNPNCEGEPETSNYCELGAVIIDEGLENCIAEGDVSHMLNYIVSGPYEAHEACMPECPP